MNPKRLLRVIVFRVFTFYDRMLVHVPISVLIIFMILKRFLTGYDIGLFFWICSLLIPLWFILSDLEFSLVLQRLHETLILGFRVYSLFAVFI